MFLTGQTTPHILTNSGTFVQFSLSSLDKYHAVISGSSSFYVKEKGLGKLHKALLFLVDLGGIEPPTN